jgi:hypothetical protein
VSATALVAGALAVLPISMPLLPPDSFEELQSRFGIPDDDDELPAHFLYRVGWPELAEAVGEVHASLAPAEREVAGLLATGFPEAGALDYYGPPLGLPQVVGTQNNYWLWGPRGTTGQVMIIVAPQGHRIFPRFADVQEVARIPCRYCAGGARPQAIFLARDPRRPLEELWQGWRDYR